MAGDNEFDGLANQEFSTQCSAPGRINLIGGHTDYNNGYVLPVAIDATIDIRGIAQESHQINCYTSTFDESTQINLDELSDTSSGWAQYIAAVTEIFRRNDYSIKGATCRIDSSLPIGIGLASSAALEVAWAGTLRSLFDLSISNRQLATFCHTAEHDIVGVNCGIMDQFTAVLAKRGHAMFLDCRDHSIQQIPFDTTTFTLLVINSKVTHELVDSAYNTRQQECETGVEILDQKLNQEITSLRDVSLSEFREIKNEISQPYQDRIAHVLQENQRVLDTVQALEKSDYDTVGKRMFESHTSLKTQYDVSCTELDAIVDILNQSDGVVGGRMTGAGFGGSVVALVRSNRVDTVVKTLTNQYTETTGIEPEIYEFQSVDGMAHRSE